MECVITAARLLGALLGTLCSGHSPCSCSPVPRDSEDAVSKTPVLRRPHPRVVLAALAVLALSCRVMRHARVWHLWKHRLLSLFLLGSRVATYASAGAGPTLAAGGALAVPVCVPPHRGVRGAVCGAV